VSLEPRHVLLVESPRLLFQLLGREIPGQEERKKKRKVSNPEIKRKRRRDKCSLLVGPLLVIKDEKEGVRVEFLKGCRVFELTKGHLRIVRRGWEGSLGQVLFWPLRVRCVWDRLKARVQHLVVGAQILRALLCRSLKQLVQVRQ